MAQLTYEDFKQRINIQDLLVDAGYQLNRRDGLRYQSYVRIGSDGRRVFSTHLKPDKSQIVITDLTKKFERYELNM